MAKITLYCFAFFATMLLTSCTEQHEQVPVSSREEPGQFTLAKARYCVIDSNVYSFRGAQVIHNNHVVFDAGASIITAEYDPVNNLLAMLCPGKLLLIDPVKWQLLDRLALTANALHLKARHGKILVLTRDETTYLSLYTPDRNNISIVSSIRRKDIRDFACSERHVGLLTSDSILLLDANLNPVNSVAVEKGVLMAMSDSFIYAKDINGIWEFPIQNNTIYEGKRFQ